MAKIWNFFGPSDPTMVGPPSADLELRQTTA